MLPVYCLAVVTLTPTLVQSATIQNSGVQWMEVQPAKAHILSVKAATDLGPYDDAWKEFKSIHGKVYKDVEEEIHRFSIFERNVMRIEEHNRLFHLGKKSYYMGVNQFTDMEHEEFANFTGLKISTVKDESCSTFLASNNLVLPDTVDWREKGYVTPVKNQGSCGSCWAFSATGSLEGQHFRKTKQLISLSEQQLVDCSGSFENEGCNGGWMDNAFKYIKIVGGIESEKDYPYVAKEHTCHFSKSDVVATDTGCVDVESGSEEELKKAVAEIGPISVAIDAGLSSFYSYDGGIYDEPECGSSLYALDHGVLAVGYGTDFGQDYWLVKNSWGTSWGEDGYIKMSRNKDNQCGIATRASYPTV